MDTFEEKSKELDDLKEELDAKRHDASEFYEAYCYVEKEWQASRKELDACHSYPT